jgi:hypothetical protein
MSPQAKKAFDELKALGVPVIDRDDESHFVISGEENTGDVIWADYYKEYQMSYLDDFGVHKDINAVLEKHGLYAEWANPGYLNVHTA